MRQNLQQLRRDGLEGFRLRSARSRGRLAGVRRFADGERQRQAAEERRAHLGRGGFCPAAPERVRAATAIEMVALDALGLDPDKYKLNVRIIGDTGTQTQAIVSGNIDAAVLPYSYGEIAKRSGARSLADAGALKVVYQATVMCSLKDSPIVHTETMTALVKGLIESLIYILEPGNKRDVAAVLKKNLRLSKEEDGEAAARVAQLQMPNVEVGLNLDAWKTVRRLVARINPKVQEVDLDQVMVTSITQNLEASGFMAEMRKRLPR